MLQNAYLLAKIGPDTAENEQHFAEILPIGHPRPRPPWTRGTPLGNPGPRQRWAWAINKEYTEVILFKMIKSLQLLQ